MSGDAAFLLAPLGLGILAEYTSCGTALHTTAAIVLVSNMFFAARATEDTSIYSGKEKAGEEDNKKQEET